MKHWLYIICLVFIFISCKKENEIEQLFKGYIWEKKKDLISEHETFVNIVSRLSNDQPNKYNSGRKHINKLLKTFKQFDSTHTEVISLKSYQNLNNQLQELNNLYFNKNQAISLDSLHSFHLENKYLKDIVTVNFYKFINQSASEIINPTPDLKKDDINFTHKKLNDSVTRIFIHSKEIYSNRNHFQYDNLFQLDSITDKYGQKIEVLQSQPFNESFSFEIDKKHLNDSLFIKGHVYMKEDDSTIFKILIDQKLILN
ncbi:hypothetical protein [Pseudofulvibacter geojedonensis]|uniref:Gliding motility-associated protein GldM N-terminal domain-containing protein n=1 Tax=Pseudofulvibacter geojedonensis TaxID=1123758 RepID=A0ABW3HZ10_9FLAO